MHEATGADTSTRSNVAGGARAVVTDIDDSQTIQEMSGDMLHGESRKQVMAAQNYGHVSHNMPPDKDAQGNVTGSAECFTGRAGGNAGFPFAGNIDDARHRLCDLSPGDVAMHRTKDDDQQIHLASDGTYISGNTGKTLRMQLVASGSSKRQPAPARGQQGGGGAQATQAWEPPPFPSPLQAALLGRSGRPTQFAAGSGGGSSTGQQSQGDQNRPTGQKAVAEAGKDSKDFVHLKSDEARVSSGKKVRLSTSKEDDDVLHEASNGKNYVGGTPAKHKFSKILTLAGPSVNGYAKIG